MHIFKVVWWNGLLSLSMFLKCPRLGLKECVDRLDVYH